VNDSQRKPALPNGDLGQVVDLTARKKTAADLGWKAGDVVLFKLDDSQLENGAEVLLGHPVFGDEMDENIYVRTVIAKGESPFPYMGMNDLKHPDQKIYKNELWRGVIQHVRHISGHPTLYVHKMEPYEEVKNAQGELLDKKDAVEAIKSGCTRCNGTITEEQIALSILRRKADGKWRIVCPKCLDEAMTQASIKAEGQPLRARSH
jgi:hypothetical protein